MRSVVILRAQPVPNIRLIRSLFCMCYQHSIRIAPVLSSPPRTLNPNRQFDGVSSMSQPKAGGRKANLRQTLNPKPLL